MLRLRGHENKVVEVLDLACCIALGAHVGACCCGGLFETAST
jgi:hypothetical protein